MLEGWEWIFIFGAVGLVTTAVMVAVILYFLARPKIIKVQSYEPQKYPQQPSSQSHVPLNFCPQCGNSVANSAKFCSNCGKQLN
jgi:hypothetical protein